MKLMKTPWMILVAALFVVAVPVHAQSAEEPIVKLLNEMSGKPEHHLAIAVYYRTLAAEARTEVEKHEAMRNTYQHDHQKFKTGASARQSMTTHCDRLIELHRETATGYEELAKLHEAEAAAN
ncbi:hypothetical protein [Immundisolibacter sp.]|uniref:hypothetical protein n=1 Tax=Immundisolibacter sp. TaxID=1934948 RepID=UPI002B1B5532|nr:hypothetical protein [Immundisolibacter sp.]MEA3221065.1 hypothetical protein [Immundisolibacter sp.]